MAELFSANGWTQPDSLGAYLEQALADDYLVIADPEIRGCPVPAVVVGRSGLLLLHDAADTAAAQQKTRAALEAFLADEFPGLRPPIRQLKVARAASDAGPAWVTAEDTATPGVALEQAIEALDGPPPATAWQNAAQPEALAAALRDRRLTITQRASQPFMFRSGGRLRTGTRAWTIRDAALHMDRHPEDGIHHLRDGTLAAWLEDEGAADLAQLAREVVNRPRIEMRAALETFLVTAGLVARPALHHAPPSLDLGYVTQGGHAARVLRLRRGRGRRGYPFGDLRTSAPWLAVEPDTFQGVPAEVVVSADTAGLAISPQPYRADVLVSGSASEEPIAVPAVVRVVANPSPANRTLLRPLAGLLAGAIVGGLIGALGPLAGVAVPDWLARLHLPGGPYVLPLTLIWALAGLIRGAQQPAAWPIRYALRRWLARSLAWAAGLASLTIIIVLAWEHGLGGGLTLPWVSLSAIALMVAGTGFFPATLDELAASRHEAIANYVHGRRSRRRTAFLAAAGIALLVAALLTPRLVAPVADRLEAGALLSPARAWVIEQWDALNRKAGELLDKAILKYYDRAAPTAPPTPTRTPAP